ncbi:phosphonate metabolism protein/1,5-bisphosphokinase (PRPP-forming) PhnN [Pseudomonas sp. R5(2019)]|uniref:phosphonate metabolism protein/1,5-bisphosphokinase (PRPP-forming) PhnN n=1 Tax=Pseudomonas sp. R5(2019) TaxID=2697566 RepID=UPI0014127882|nr:phosphonate metabolism protein/1,5-bisphosphokinase (PRPP-forming) PhnN [Pseudomonas sp. R5(2019)]NBA95711.1 phosphonate metabolism protein/1,5-bisphosphokinase (PRPP-forming) PhnN [Pseudomonas sp. R5(2019)]
MVGRLIYLMGPSGSGKDSLINAARSDLQCRQVRVVQRVITRSAEAVGEDAIGVTPAMFEQLRQAGTFAMHWLANGLCYGIPAQIDEWLANGEDVVVNGSRGYLEEALRRYPDLLPVLVHVQSEVLRQRLVSRGRESLEEIERRLARNDQFDSGSQSRGGVVIARLDNSTSLEDAVQRLLQLFVRVEV